MFGTGIKRIVDAYKDCPIKPKFEIAYKSVVVNSSIFEVPYF